MCLFLLPFNRKKPAFRLLDLESDDILNVIKRMQLKDITKMMRANRAMSIFITNRRPSFIKNIPGPLWFTESQIYTDFPDHYSINLWIKKYLWPKSFCRATIVYANIYDKEPNTERSIYDVVKECKIFAETLSISTSVLTRRIMDVFQPHKLCLENWGREQVDDKQLIYPDCIKQIHYASAGNQSVQSILEQFLGKHMDLQIDRVNCFNFPEFNSRDAMADNGPLGAVRFCLQKLGENRCQQKVTLNLNDNVDYFNKKIDLRTQPNCLVWRKFEKVKDVDKYKYYFFFIEEVGEGSIGLTYSMSTEENSFGDFRINQFMVKYLADFEDFLTMFKSSIEQLHMSFNESDKENVKNVRKQFFS